MAAATARALIAGAAGRIEVASAIPEGARALAVIAHPHPLFGGTMDNKVVTTLTRAFVEAGAATYRSICARASARTSPLRHRRYVIGRRRGRLIGRSLRSGADGNDALLF